MKTKKIITLTTFALTASLLAGCTARTKNHELADRYLSRGSGSYESSGGNATTTTEKGDTTTQSQGDDTSSDPVEELQYFNTYLTAEPPELDASLTTSNSSIAVILCILEPLTRNQAADDGSYKIIPAGAESWETNDDKTVWTFHLRDNYWSDGQPVTAYDYEYSIKRTVDPANDSGAAFMIDCILNYSPCHNGEMDIDELGIRAIDDKTLEVTLDAPVPHFIETTYSYVFTPLRKDIIERFGENYGTSGDTVLSCGPFKMSSWVHDEVIELVINENYWDIGKKSLEKVTYYIMPDEQDRYEAFKSGKIDTVDVVSADSMSEFQSMDNAKLTTYPTASIDYMLFNTKDELFKNEKVRKAFIISTDRDDVNEKCYSSFRQAAYGWVVPALTVGELNFRDGSGGPAKDLMSTYSDPKALLIEGMEELGLGDDPSTLTVSLRLQGESEWYQNFGDYFKECWESKLGITLEVGLSDRATYMSDRNSGNYQIGYGGWTADYKDVMSVLSLFLSKSDTIHTGWANEEYDNLIAAASREQDDQKRLALYTEAERILIYESGVINPLVNSVVNSFRKDYVKGPRDFAFGTNSMKNIYIFGRS